MTAISDAGTRWAPAVRCGPVAVPDDERAAKAHNVRVPEPRWLKFGRILLVGQTRTGVINQFIAWYCREPGAKLPQRPSDEH